VISSVAGSTLTIALSPPSVTQAKPSGPTITPCGADPGPSGRWRVAPDSGSRYPSSPDLCAVYHTPPSRAGATSWGRDPSGTSNVTTSRSENGTGSTVACDSPPLDVVMLSVEPVVGSGDDRSVTTLPSPSPAELGPVAGVASTAPSSTGLDADTATPVEPAPSLSSSVHAATTNTDAMATDIAVRFIAAHLPTRSHRP
jgi:hypothetical protein